MNEILQQCRRLPPEIGLEHLTKINKNNKFQDGGDRHCKFHLSLTTRLLLHTFAQNLAPVLSFKPYIRTCQNIEQTYNLKWQRPPS